MLQDPTMKVEVVESELSTLGTRVTPQGNQTNYSQLQTGSGDTFMAVPPNHTAGAYRVTASDRMH